ncbi:TonB-dependent receptor [Pseudoxanthomonas kalamensis]|uniref:TonB-dependent receptor n=1 Tax=Pseudoxanthomonas kalamensis TaxID=289483 RepID=UPI001FE9E51A|nr:TonB-dependent receptor [Pseudoxanthomonas kalamensis]
MSKLTLGLVAALAAAPAFAQSTSSGVGGQVIDSSGAPVAGAEVTITHVESGTVSRATTDASGRYVARGLRVGGPYTITVTKAGTGTDTEEGVYLELNKVGNVDAQLGSGDATTLGTVAVVGSRGLDVFTPDNKGVGTSVSGRQLELLPQGNRSLDDVARLDPRVTVIDQAGGSISVAGVNNRFNNIMVDGLSQNDPFGLNSNGMPYTGSPISVDTIEAYDIKVSDYDVSQDTVGATINAVTKSGTNEFHGSVYYAMKDAGSMVASRDGQDYDLFDKDETYGVTIGGPIIKDKLFFFASYEEQEISEFGGATPADGVANGLISMDEVNQAIAIADSWGVKDNAYGALDSVLKNKRYLAKIDWNINDYHRASLTYQQTEEARPIPYDLSSNTAILTNHWYFRNVESKNTSLQLFSDWTDNFSTEFKVSQQKFDQIDGAFVDNTESIVYVEDGRIFIGEDDNRHENQINTKQLAASLSGTYYAGNHTIKGGVDFQRHDVFNLYGKTLHGEYQFRDKNGNGTGLDEFEAGDYYSYAVRRPVGSYSEADTAAALVYSQISPFIQDIWQVTDKLSIQYGVRVNIPKADKAPEVSPGFEEAFGFTNAYKLGTDNKVILPRFSFNYTFDTERYSQLRGGIGAFQSIPPFVWLANPYQNTGVTARRFSWDDPSTLPYDPTDPYNMPIPPGADISGSVDCTASAPCQVDVIDPDFKLPTVWKVSLGYDAELPWLGLIGSVEVQHIRNRDGIFYQALNIGTPQGVLADGRESYWCTLGGSTSNSNKNCGLDPAFAYNSTLLGNTDKGASTAVTFALDKPLSDGWFGGLSVTYTHATEVASDGSSQAFSSYQYVSRVNPNQEIATTAGRVIPLSVKASLGWEHAFFGDYKTSVAAYYNGHDGLPYTWTFDGDANGDRIYQDPAYIPLINDPLVSYGSATPEQIAAFHAFIDSNPYLASRRGSIAGRNEDHYSWVNQLDLGIQQELPGFFKEHKAVVRLDIYNFLNLLNKDWGQTEGETFSDNTRYLAYLAGVNADGTYEYDLSRSSSPESVYVYDSSSSYPSRLVSRWSALLTLRYEF